LPIFPDTTDWFLDSIDGFVGYFLSWMLHARCVLWSPAAASQVILLVGWDKNTQAKKIKTALRHARNLSD
jgi:hypothetical protein